MAESGPRFYMLATEEASPRLALKKKMFSPLSRQTLHV